MTEPVEELLARGEALLARSGATAAESLAQIQSLAAKYDDNYYNLDTSVPSWVREVKKFPPALRAEQRQGRLRDKGHWALWHQMCVLRGRGAAGALEKVQAFAGRNGGGPMAHGG